jgi:tRNA 2-thiouridine synthesizing protein A
MPTPHHKLNALGMLCPLPLLFAARDMAKLDPGQVLEIAGDDPALHEDVPAWCDRAGHRLLEIEEDEGVIVCYVEKGDGAATQGA